MEKIEIKKIFFWFSGLLFLFFSFSFFVFFLTGRVEGTSWRTATFTRDRPPELKTRTGYRAVNGEVICRVWGVASLRTLDLVLLLFEASCHPPSDKAARFRFHAPIAAMLSPERRVSQR
jgi:hypothetical protein